MNHKCNTKFKNYYSTSSTSRLNEKQLLLIFLQLVQSRQKRLRNQRKNHCSFISSNTPFSEETVKTAIDEELEYEGEAKRETSKDYRKQWRHISDMIHVALEECSHNYVSNISTVTGCQKYEGLEQEVSQFRTNGKDHISFKSSSTRLCYCWLIVAILVIIIIIIVTTWKGRS